MLSTLSTEGINITLFLNASIGQGIEVAPSDQKLQFDCGGQQWAYEVCFPVGTYGLPNSNSMGFVEEECTLSQALIKDKKVEE